MFTGIIHGRGVLRSITATGADGNASDRRLVIGTPDGFLDGADLGDSICVNGICLTAVELSDEPGRASFATDASIETLECTTMGAWAGHEGLNLERSVTPATALGGHLVSGHIDGVVQVTARTPDARSTRYEFAVPTALARFVAPKGSVCIDGVSLTVNGVCDDGGQTRFDVNIVPHTAEMTGFSSLDVGHWVNLEVDQIARYLDRLASAPRPAC